MSSSTAERTDTATSDDELIAWRGVATEDAENITASLSSLLRARTRRLTIELTRPYRRRLAILALSIVINQVAILGGPWLVSYGIDSGIPQLTHHPGGPDPWPLIAAVAGVVVAAIIQALTFKFFVAETGRVGQRILFDLRNRLFNHTQRLSVGFHEAYTSGRVISRLTSDMDSINDLFEEGLQSLVIMFLSAVACGAAMIALDPILGGMAVASFPIVLLITRWFRGQASRAYRATRDAVALLIVHFTESLAGIRAVQAFRREARNQAIYEQLNDRYRRANAWTQRLGAVYGPSLEMLGYIITAAALTVGALQVLHGNTKIGVIIAIYLYLRQFFSPMQELAQFYNMFQAAAAALEKSAGVLDEQPAVPEPADAGRPVRSLPAGSLRRGEIRLQGVRFAYREDLPPVLGADEPFELLIPSGQTVAVVGRTGAGKSTIARLVSRFYDPSEGRVLLDGIDVRNLPDAELRRMVATVTQENFLFSGTVADNIAFGRPEASRAEVEAAAASIGAHDFISRLPEGYDTDVRKRGGRLSAGQRQLVSFARAALADPWVLILDEATSSLDLPSERLVQHALITLLSDRSAIIIAHRLSTVEIADRVLVIDDGRIVEDGSPEELIRSGGQYGELHRAWLEALA